MNLNRVSFNEIKSMNLNRRICNGVFSNLRKTHICRNLLPLPGTRKDFWQSDNYFELVVAQYTRHIPLTRVDDASFFSKSRSV